MMETLTQLYLITGILSLAILSLFGFVVLIYTMLAVEKSARLKSEERFLTMADPAIQRGEELERRGYGMYQGPDPGQMHSVTSEPHPAKPSKNKGHSPSSQQQHQQQAQRPGSIPSVNTSIYQGYPGRATDPIPYMYPTSSNPPPMQQGGVRSSKNNYR